MPGSLKASACRLCCWGMQPTACLLTWGKPATVAWRMHTSLQVHVLHGLLVLSVHIASEHMLQCCHSTVCCRGANLSGVRTVQAS